MREKEESPVHLNQGYKVLLGEIKHKVKSSRLQAVVAVNQELIKLYWYIGKQIIEKQARSNWGSRFIETLSHDLQTSFPGTRGFSVRNLKYMRQFASSYDFLKIGQQPVAQLPWGHIMLLIQRVKDVDAREWCVKQIIGNGWSRHTLEFYIKRNLYQSQAILKTKASNFLERLPPYQSAFAQDLLKSPYNFDFLGLNNTAHEREIERTSIQHITKFLLELGKGFAFVGNQVPIVIGDQEFFIDMLFYNLKLHCYVVVEFKSTKFKPAHVGQLNFYLNAVDDLIKQSQDNSTIGLLLCKSRNKVVAEYALKSIENPMGISEYELMKVIPVNLKSNLPTIEEIEEEFNLT
jgi:predicted nuclease of restriction endonuclease-like (RecB) superfamily